MEKVLSLESKNHFTLSDNPQVKYENVPAYYHLFKIESKEEFKEFFEKYVTPFNFL